MIWTVFQISLLRLWNNKHEVLLTLLIPILFFSIFALIFSRGVGQNTSQISVSFIDDDRSELTQNVIRAALDQPSISRATGVGNTLEDWPIDKLSRLLITQVEASLIVHFPQGFDSRLRSEDAIPVEILDEGTNPVGKQIVEAVLTQALASELGKSMEYSAGMMMVSRSSATSMTGGLLSGNLPGTQPVNTTKNVTQQSINPQFASTSRPGSASSAATSLTGFQRPIAQSSFMPGSADSDAPATQRIDSQPLALRPEPMQTSAPVHLARAPLTTLGRPNVKFINQNVFAYNKHHPKIAMYAAGIAVMFLLFSANGASGSILEEKEAGTLERLLSSRLTITQLLLGKWLFITWLGLVQLTAMFAWGQMVFGIDFTGHLVGFAVLAVPTAGAGASFALLLASLCKTRNQLNGVSVIIVLSMSALGGSMIPRYIMSESMQRLGRLTFNGWALDGFKKIFWYDLPASAVRTEVLVLCGITIIFGIAARFFAPRWSAM